MSKVHVKVNDMVFVLTGKDKGKNGKVISVDHARNRVVVEGVHMVTKHQKPTMRQQNGGIVKKEGSIDASNVMVVCPKCKRPSKLGVKYLENGEKVRYCKACGATIDTLHAAKEK